MNVFVVAQTRLQALGCLSPDARIAELDPRPRKGITACSAAPERARL